MLNVGQATIYTACLDCVNSYDEELVQIAQDTANDIVTSALSCNESCSDVGDPELQGLCLESCEVVLDMDDQAKAIVAVLNATLDKNDCLDKNGCFNPLLAEIYEETKNKIC